PMVAALTGAVAISCIPPAGDRGDVEGDVVGVFGRTRVGVIELPAGAAARAEAASADADEIRTTLVGALRRTGRRVAFVDRRPLDGAVAVLRTCIPNAPDGAEVVFVEVEGVFARVRAGVVELAAGARVVAP